MLIPVAALTFLAVFCVCVAVSVAVAERQNSPKTELKRRLQRMARSSGSAIPEDLRAEITRETRPADQFFAGFAPTKNLDRKLDQAGLAVSVSLFVSVVVAAAILCSALVMLITKSLAFCSASAVLSLLLADFFLKIKAQLRREKFTELFPDALSMIARSLRAGHSFTSAIQLVGQEVPAPVGELFKTAYDQQLLGLRMTDGLSSMNDRIDSLDLRFFTTVVSINSEIGGNLSEVLDKLSLTIRERLRIRRQVQVYTAQGRMSGYVLGVLPLVTFAFFFFLHPDYEMELFRDPKGIYIVVLAVSLQLFGLMVIRKIIRIQI
ncbi:type II secretion system F family protein [Geomonas sp.]|uniref:type II secretion system F family protein n=1 Tax=Geomonas sp. TaxID=2651584 RepID=UPI002B48616C|nr:type II secretion system F family protein [Geomonas sp.]HJV35013.1 type II secretion system F family protein [Geomonas sp.]